LRKEVSRDKAKGDTLSENLLHNLAMSLETIKSKFLTEVPILWVFRHIDQQVERKAVRK
jgi:hypothetical protein